MTPDSPLREEAQDGELLAQFARSGEQTPFEQIVDRHGTLVLSVCRGVLGGAGAQHDAEDAAQATFLTLANKAGSLANYDSVAGWLYRVAWHISKRSRAARELRTRREQAAAKEHLARLAEGAPEKPELVETLHDELNKLPEKYRLPLILHHLEGWTEPEIAQMLDARVGTISSRISRGRQMLRDRMAKHGPKLGAVTAVAVGTALAEQARANAVTPALQEQLVAVASTSAAVSPSAAALAHGAATMLRRQATLTFASWTGFAGVTFVVVLTIVSVLLSSLGHHSIGELLFPDIFGGSKQARVPFVAYDHPLTHATSAHGREEQEVPTLFGEVVGKVVDDRGQPVRNARVKIYFTALDAQVSATPLSYATTNPDGTFVLEGVPVGEKFFITCVIRRPEYAQAHAEIGLIEEGARVDAGTIKLDALKTKEFQGTGRGATRSRPAASPPPAPATPSKK